MQIRNTISVDLPALVDIYNYYVEHSSVTFAEKCVDVDYFDQAVQAAKYLDVPFLVFENQRQELLGFTRASAWRKRSAYRHSLECGIYIRNDCHGQGIGKKLYSELIKQIKAKQQFHLLIGGITLPNEASVVLHESLGFKKVAHFEEVGRKFGQWLDVGYWSLKI